MKFTTPVPQRARALAADIKEVRAAFEKNGVQELVIEHCRFARGQYGQDTVDALSNILSTQKNHVKVGGFSDYVRTDQPQGSSTVDVGQSTGHDDPKNQWNNTSSEKMPEPQVWSH